MQNKLRIFQRTIKIGYSQWDNVCDYFVDQRIWYCTNPEWPNLYGAGLTPVAAYNNHARRYNSYTNLERLPYVN